MDNKNYIGLEIRKLTIMIKRYIDNFIAENYHERPTGVHGWVIGYIYKNRDKDVFQRDLEEEFSIRRSTATTILKLMEKNGYITRTTTDYDARLKKLELTPKALEFHEIMSKEIEKIEANLVKGISDEELKSFFKTVKKIKNNIEQLSK